MINTPLFSTTYSLGFTLIARLQFYQQGPMRFKFQIELVHWSVTCLVPKVEWRTICHPCFAALLKSARAHLVLFQCDGGPSLAYNQRPSPDNHRCCIFHSFLPFAELEVLDLVKRRWLREIYR